MIRETDMTDMFLPSRSYKNLGLTEREKAIWPPASRAVPWDVIAVLTVLGIMLLGVFVYPSPGTPTAHADDKEEAVACRAWLNGAKVSGGTQEDIRKHCAQYL